jgi:RHS repeat-associated protein
VSYTYDRAGNLTQRIDSLGGAPITWAYGYDALERLVSVRRNGTLIARYGYDVQGRRIVKRVYSGASGGVVGYLRMSYAGSQVAFETDSVGTTLRTRYTWGPGTDQLVSVRDTTNAHYVAVTDQLGSVRALVKRDGTWAGRLRYDPYGNLVDSAGPQPPLRYRWTGREWDAETGFYFHRTRYYDPQAQRFVQEDQIGYAGGSNLYAYVGGDVLEAKDSDGLIKDATWARAGWDVMCLGIDRCIGASGDLRPVSGGGTFGERQSAGLQTYGANAYLEFLWRSATISITVENGGVKQTITFRNGRPNTDTCEPCKSMPVGAAAYVGLVIDVFTIEGGATGARGAFVDAQGFGVYSRAGLGAGMDFSVSVEAGYSADFWGVAVEGQLGVGEWSVSGSASLSGRGGISGGWGKSPLTYTTHAAFTYTWARYNGTWR